jgi:ACS family pantothenate transporter-like MFS transporter
LPSSSAGSLKMALLNIIFASSYNPATKPPFFFWYPKGTPASEKKLLFKIDFFILTFGCLAYFTKWLDQANLSNAYVSGMKEDLRMYGTEYNLAVTCFQVGTIIGGIPSNLLLTWVPPRILLPGCELLWAVLTVATYKVTSYNQVKLPFHIFEDRVTDKTTALPPPLLHRVSRRFFFCRHNLRPWLLV